MSFWTISEDNAPPFARKAALYLCFDSLALEGFLTLHFLTDALALSLLHSRHRCFIPATRILLLSLQIAILRFMSSLFLA